MFPLPSLWHEFFIITLVLVFCCRCNKLQKFNGLKQHKFIPILRWEDYLGLAGWAQCNYKGLYLKKKKEAAVSEIEDATLPALKIVKGTRS